MPISTMSSCLSTKICVLKARLLLRKFFLSDRSNGLKIPMKKLGEICKPRSKVGLGIRRMRNFNNALIAKLGRECLDRNIFSIPKANSSFCLWKHTCDSRNITKRAKL